MCMYYLNFHGNRTKNELSFYHTVKKFIKWKERIEHFHSLVMSLAVLGMSYLNNKGPSPIMEL